MTSTMFRPMALAAALGVLAILGADAPPGQPGKNSPNGQKTAAAKKAEGKTEPQVKAIRLSNVSPEEVREAMTSIWPMLTSSREVQASGISGTVPIAINARTKTVFIRGTDKQLEMVEDLIKMLDAAPDQEIRSRNGLHVVRLRHAKVQEVVQVLAGLGLQQQVIALPRLNALILPTSKRQAEDVQVVIENLDTDGSAKTGAPSASSAKR